MELHSSSTGAWHSQPATVLTGNTQPADSSRPGYDRVVCIDSFDDASDRAWLELVRDVAALANSGGGTIIISCRNDEDRQGSVPRTIDLAASDVIGRLTTVTDCDYADIRLAVLDRNTNPAIEITVAPAKVPIVFTATGEFTNRGKQGDRDVAFTAGSFYVRHGNRSEPGTSADLRAFFEQRLRVVRHKWLNGIRRAMTVPANPSSGQTNVDSVKKRGQNLQPVRIVNDPNAPALHPTDVYRLYPWRQKDLVRELHHRLGHRTLNSYDIQAVRRQHHLDERPEFIFNLPGAGRRYSPAVAEWMIEQHARNVTFFDEARAADHEMFRQRRQKPR